MNKVYTVTKDISADYKKLRTLEKKSLIKIISIRFENNKNKKSAILPTAVWDHTMWNFSRWGSSEQSKVFEKLKRIIGKNNIQDCIHLEAHIRDKYDYFVTEDKDILSKRSELKNEFLDLKIKTVKELVLKIEGGEN